MFEEHPKVRHFEERSDEKSLSRAQRGIFQTSHMRSK
jgi:hypothetical protein